jgi:multicomponent Na+:H+ antiporter subunit E
MEDQDPREYRHETPETRDIEPSPPMEEEESGGRFRGRLVLFAILLLFWVLFSGRFDAFHLTLGLISCTIVTLFTGDLVPELRSPGLMGSWIRFGRYIPWLMGQILLANLHILRLVFHPRMMEQINPHILRFESSLKTELSLVTFANSITLTPGTITVSVSVDGQFKVHAIDEHSGEALPGSMETRIQKAFGEI